MKKVWWIIIGIIVLLVILLIWGYVGKIYIDSSVTICDIGIKQKVTYDSSVYNDSLSGLGIVKLREYDTYLCWTWHKEPGPTQEQINEEVKNQTDRLFGP